MRKKNTPRTYSPAARSLFPTGPYKSMGNQGSRTAEKRGQTPMEANSTPRPPPTGQSVDWRSTQDVRNDSEITDSFNRAGIAPRVGKNLPRPAGHAVKRRDRDAEAIPESSPSEKKSRSGGTEGADTTTDLTEGTDRHGLIRGHPFRPFHPWFLFDLRFRSTVSHEQTRRETVL